MSNVWFAVPSKRPFDEAMEVFRLWRNQGYNVAIQRDESEAGPDYDRGSWKEIELVSWRQYYGYAEAVNHLVAQILYLDPAAEWIVTGGDDTEPDLAHSAQEIAAQCSEHFNGTLGILQCTGDRWGESRSTHPFQKWPEQPRRCVHCGQGEEAPPHLHGAYIDRVAGSPWLGREWCMRGHGGRGPLHPDFTHMFVDQALRETAVMLGIYWERRDLIMLHRHWGRGVNDRPVTADAMPNFLAQWNTPEQWNAGKALYERLKADGFKECLPI